MPIVKCDKPEAECILTEHKEGQCFLPAPETALSQFTAMLKDAGEKYKIIDNNNYSTSVIFTVYSGICGSSETVGEAIFRNMDGKLLGIHHCD